MAVPGVENFVGVGGRNSCNLVGALDCTLHKVNVTVIFNDSGISGVKADNVINKLHTVSSLILDVVDCKQALDVVVPWSV